jgi:hypothetical protein
MQSSEYEKPPETDISGTPRADFFKEDHGSIPPFTTTNSEFLTAIFDNLIAPDREPEQLHSWITTFAVDPNSKDVSWNGNKWTGAPIFGEAGGYPLNTFFSIAALKAITEKGATLPTIKRRKTNFAAMPCIMLDDVGTKAEGAALPPTWKIETSPGNYQVGYVFIDPITSASDADILCKGLSTGGLLTDQGGFNGVRYARLPVGFNTKARVIEANSGTPFPHRLVEWEPSQRYDWREMAEAFGLDLDIFTPVRNRESRNALRETKRKISNDDEVFSPRADENPVIAALKSKGLYKVPLGSGKHDITCPWVMEHTEAVDGGTAYFEPDEVYPRGGFKCLHGHCSERRIRHLLEFLEVSVGDAKHKPTIRVIGGALHSIVDHAERLLADTGYYFQQGGLIIQIVTDPRGETRVVPVNKNTVARILTRVATWQKYDKRAEDWFDIDAPDRHAGVLWDSSEYRHLPPLMTLARQPFMRADGSVCMAAGYDCSSGIFGIFDPRAFPTKENPSKDDALAALVRLEALLAEFEFKSDEDKAAAESTMLTAAVRPSLPTAPGFLGTAHSYGSGKSYLLDILAGFATPDSTASTTFVIDDDEMRKQLVATLMESPAVVKFDEMKGDLIPVKCLLSALTSERIEGRILGVSKMTRPSTRTLMLFAGNNVSAMEDMTRRIVTIHLDPRCEHPASRVFAHDPLTELMQNRERYVADALTVIRAWVCAGSPRADVRAVNGFSQWAAWCREPLLWLGRADPCASMFAAMQDDPDRELLGRVLTVWAHCFDTSPTMVKEIVKRAEAVDDLKDVMLEIAGFKGDIDRRRLGHWIKNHAGKIVDSRRLVKDTTVIRNSDVWKLTVLADTPKRTDTTDSIDPEKMEKTADDSRMSRFNRMPTPYGAKVSDASQERIVEGAA